MSLKDQGVHLDGKVLRRSFDAAAGRNALNMVTAWASDLHLCLGQLPVEAGSNEQTAVPRLIELLELTGAVVTLDAMHTRKAIARQIHGKGADYVLTVRSYMRIRGSTNQKKLHGLVNATFEELADDNLKHPRVRSFITREKNGGREEYRRYTVFPAPAEVRQQGWTDARTIGMVYRERTVNGKTSQELIYFVSSLPPQVRKIAKQIRDHWKIENQLHWSLDVTFAEDTSRIRKDSGPANAGIFRRLALSLGKRYEEGKLSMRLNRQKASWCFSNLLQYLTGNQA